MTYSYLEMAQKCRKFATECQGDSYQQLITKFNNMATDFDNKSTIVVTNENNVITIIAQKIEKIQDIVDFWNLRLEKYRLELEELKELLNNAQLPEDETEIKQMIKETTIDYNEAQISVNDWEEKVQNLANQASQTYHDISQRLENCVNNDTCEIGDCEDFRTLIQKYLLAEYERYQNFLRKNCPEN